jgi:hypothetical protein
MPKLPYMLKHRGFPSRLPGTDFQFTIRRAAPVATKIEKRERHPDRKKILIEADTNFLACLWNAFGDLPFERGNLDAGRIGTLFMREVKPMDDKFDPQDYEAMLYIDEYVARARFPKSFEEENYR